MWTHGWWTNGERWPLNGGEARAGERVAAAVRNRAIDRRPALRAASGITVSAISASSRWTVIYTAWRVSVSCCDRRSAHDLRTDPTVKGGPYRSSATSRPSCAAAASVFHRHRRCERILVSTIDLAGDWQGWKASAPVELLRPEASYECADLSTAPSAAGEIEGKARQLRDPGIFEEAGKGFLFYSICGEQGLAAAELTFR
jgi:hypothetical protein